MCQFAFCLGSVLWLLVGGCLKMKLKEGQVASIELCLLRKRNLMRLMPTDFGKLTSDTTIAYQMFSFEPDSIKLGGACCSNDYTNNENEVPIYALHVNHQSLY